MWSDPANMISDGASSDAVDIDSKKLIKEPNLEHFKCQCLVLWCDIFFIYGKIEQNVYSEQYWNNRLPQIIAPLTFCVKEKNNRLRLVLEEI